MALDPIDVIRRFEPILYFHRDERFFPSDAKRYMERCALWDVNGSPRDSKVRWGGTSAATFPHRPRIPRGKLIVGKDELPVVPGHARQARRGHVHRRSEAGSHHPPGQ